MQEDKAWKSQFFQAALLLEVLFELSDLATWCNLFIFRCVRLVETLGVLDGRGPKEPGGVAIHRNWRCGLCGDLVVASSEFSCQILPPFWAAWKRLRAACPAALEHLPYQFQATSDRMSGLAENSSRHRQANPTMVLTALQSESQADVAKKSYRDTKCIQMHYWDVYSLYRSFCENLSDEIHHELHTALMQLPCLLQKLSERSVPPTLKACELAEDDIMPEQPRASNSRGGMWKHKKILELFNHRINDGTMMALRCAKKNFSIRTCAWIIGEKESAQKRPSHFCTTFVPQLCQGLPGARPPWPLLLMSCEPLALWNTTFFVCH